MGKTVVTVASLKHMGLKNTSAFIKDLDSLNHAIADAQKAADVPCVVVGGLLYGHLIPDFHLSPVTPDADWKRASFASECAAATRLFEIGVSAGHSILIAKHANPDLKVVCADIATADKSDMSQHIAVKTAVAWLQDRFDDITYIEGDSRIVIPTFAAAHDGPPFDLIHLDGDKYTHFQEALSFGPIITRDTRIIIDDTQSRVVRRGIRRMKLSRLFRDADNFTLPPDVRFGHHILSPNL